MKLHFDTKLSTTIGLGSIEHCIDPLIHVSENAIVIVPGANMLLGDTELQKAHEALSHAKVMICQLEVNPDTSLKALHAAHKHHVKTIFNPAPAASDLSQEFYKLSDILCCNETEAEILTGKTVTTMEDAGKVSLELLARGCGSAIVTLGSQGCVVLSSQDSCPKHIPATSVTAVDTTGAGDSFIGALAFYVAYYSSLTLEEMVRRANVVASLSVQKEGTQTSFPSRRDLPAELL
ncbi:hypothetical protein ACEWY4_005894 [Coilia grayii]|uniref:Ribokinase n=1 Tax=Coilia grayii TaxID=363190 RepID=A0ABD1KJR5_9TELE